MNISQLSLVRIMQRPSRCWNTALRLINNLIMSKKFPPASFLWFLGTDTKNFYPHINSDIQNDHVYSLPQSFNTHPPTFFSSDIITLTITPYIICGTDALRVSILSTSCALYLACTFYLNGNDSKNTLN